jgi:hypothetical protein
MLGRSSRFDRDYYARYYGRTKTRVQGPREVARLARGVMEMVALSGGTVENALDIGAGTGLWRDWFKKHATKVRYRTTDVSEYACARYGHEQRDISKWRARERFDLIVCQGVLPYLDDRAAGKAIENLAAMSRGYLYLEAITREDLAAVCDLGATDVEIHRRPVRWYRRRLKPHFLQLGLGLWMRRGAPHLLYALEHGE